MFIETTLSNQIIQKYFTRLVQKRLFIFLGQTQAKIKTKTFEWLVFLGYYFKIVAVIVLGLVLNIF